MGKGLGPQVLTVAVPRKDLSPSWLDRGSALIFDCAFLCDLCEPFAFFAVKGFVSEIKRLLDRGLAWLKSVSGKQLLFPLAIVHQSPQIPIQSLASGSAAMCR
jgi:hypothetical protein